MNFLRTKTIFLCSNIAVALMVSGCATDETTVQTSNSTDSFKSKAGPNIRDSGNNPQDSQALSNWITQSVALLESDLFRFNIIEISNSYPEVWVSDQNKTTSTLSLINKLSANDPDISELWWPTTYVKIEGTAQRDTNINSSGFQGNEDAGANYYRVEPDGKSSGIISLGRVHLARFEKGDPVEKSCAINTMTHEISHSLSDKKDIFWMHILDTEDGVNPPAGMFKASYLIGTVAQCTHLQNVGRIGSADLLNCVETFGDPTYQTGSPLEDTPFASGACNNFPGSKPITPAGRDTP